MPSPGQSWPVHMKVIASVFHILAISSGIFRTTYRWYISRFGWEDGWAFLALLSDVGCLICAWLSTSTPVHPPKKVMILNWVTMFLLTSTLWGARLSMIATIIRITNPLPFIRRISYAVGFTFGLMWATSIALKSYNCIVRLCALTHSVAITQLLTDVISDTLLVVTSSFFLKGVKIPWEQRVLLVSSFASSICITIVTIAHSILIYLPVSSASLLAANIKVALAVIICNLLVIVTFAYRVIRKTDIDVSRTSVEDEQIQLSSVILVTMSHASRP